MYPASVEYLNRQRIIPNWEGGLWEQWYIYIFAPFSLFVSVYAYAFVCDFVCIALLLPFVLGFCLSVFFCLFGIFLVYFSVLVTIGEFVFLVWLFSSFFLPYFLITEKNFFNNYSLFFILITFILVYFIIFFFLSFFLPFILSRVDDRLLVLQPGIKTVPLTWESQGQDIGPPETSQLYVISNGENFPEISMSTPRPSSTQGPASYSAGHPMPNN